MPGRFLHSSFIFTDEVMGSGEALILQVLKNRQPEYFFEFFFEFGRVQTELFGKLGQGWGILQIVGKDLFGSKETVLVC